MSETMSPSRSGAAGVPRAARPRPVLAVGLVLALYYGIQWLTSVLTVHPHLPLSDEIRAGGWVQAFDHHFWQMVLALGAIALLGGAGWKEWGLNLRHHQESGRIIGRFVKAYGLYFIGIGFLVQLLFVRAPAPDHPLTPQNIAGHLAFGFLFVGVSEEILFRGLIHTCLARHWTRVRRWRGIEMPDAGIIATFVFTVAHIGFRLAPPEITHLYWPQIAMAFVLGLFYSWAYHRTGSLLAPILTHNFSDGSLWVSEYLLIWLKG